MNSYNSIQTVFYYWTAAGKTTVRHSVSLSMQSQLTATPQTERLRKLNCIHALVDNDKELDIGFCYQIKPFAASSAALLLTCGHLNYCSYLEFLTLKMIFGRVCLMLWLKFHVKNFVKQTLSTPMCVFSKGAKAWGGNPYWLMSLCNWMI